MKQRLLDFLCCPECSGELNLVSTDPGQGDVESGELICTGCDRAFPVAASIPRFVAGEHYTTGFGLQWNRYRRTQLDSHSGVPVSAERFFTQSGWDPQSMNERLVLDVGCGAGRFAEIALAAGAEVVAVDYSSAVDACRDNLAPHRGLHIVQADIYHLPFRAEGFDFVYCFGVLQHTPNVELAFRSLPRLVRHGGRLAVDVYPTSRLNLFLPKYWLRHVTKRLSPGLLLRIVERAVEPLLMMSELVRRVPRLGPYLCHLVPVANYSGVYPLTADQLREWAALDTFDMLSPAYDQPQSAATLTRWFKDAGLNEVEIFRPGHLVGRAVK